MSHKIFVMYTYILATSYEDLCFSLNHMCITKYDSKEKMMTIKFELL